MEERLKNLMQELGSAINETLSDSDRIEAAIVELRKAGYEAFLVIEATIGLGRLGAAAPEAEEPAPYSVSSATPGQLKWTPQDQKFLRALKIAVDQEER